MSKDKLPKVFKKKWLAALRSGKYAQAEGSLYKDGAYCCLGVACKVAGIGDDNLITQGFVNSAIKGSEKIPNIIAMTNDIPTHLANMNDWEDKSFDEIADYIEENL